MMDHHEDDPPYVLQEKGFKTNKKYTYEAHPVQPMNVTNKKKTEKELPPMGAAARSSIWLLQVQAIIRSLAEQLLDLLQLLLWHRQLSQAQLIQEM